MIRYDKISLIIETRNNEDKTEKYGRIINLKNGLNIIAGDNTSGKTTLAKCFYYILGVEEIIDGKQFSLAMDKSTSKEFKYLCQDGTYHIKSVVNSYVQAQLSNEDNKCITLKRYIKSEDNTRTIKVWECAEDKISKETSSTEYYVHSKDDHNTDLPFGFFQYLSKFAKLALPEVLTKNGRTYPLYLKTILALNFIEQTKGWTDYFATIRGYNFIQPKQRIIEYALGVNFNSEDIKYKTLSDENTEIKEKWCNTVKDLTRMLTANNLCILGLFTDISKQKTNLSSLKVFTIDKIKHTQNNDTLTIYEEIKEMKDRLIRLESNNELSDDSRFDSYKKQLSSFKDKQNKIASFTRKYLDEKIKLKTIDTQIENIEEEIRRNKNIEKVPNNLITTVQMQVCPTCHRRFDNNDNIAMHIGTEELINNIKYLKSQLSFLSAIGKNIRESISEKEIYLSYYKKTLLLEKEKLNSAYNDISQFAHQPSEQEMMEIADLKIKIKTYEYAIGEMNKLLPVLSELKQKFDKNKDEQKKSKKQDTNRESILNKLEQKFKFLLSKFGYRSNNISNVSLLFNDKTSNSLYLPQVDVSGYEESVRSVSSASDLVRSIWAFYIALLEIGNKHPGFLVFDEPCQHSINEHDLKTLFETCSFSKKQIILFCSSEPKTLETQNVTDKININGKKTNIEKLICKIDNKEYNLIQMGNGELSISKL